MKRSTAIRIKNSENLLFDGVEISGYDTALDTKNVKNLRFVRSKIVSTIAHVPWTQTWWGITILGIFAGIIVYLVTKII